MRIMWVCWYVTRWQGMTLRIRVFLVQCQRHTLILYSTISVPRCLHLPAVSLKTMFLCAYPWKFQNLLTFRLQSVLYDSLDVEHASLWCSSVLPDWELTMVWVFVCGGFQQLGQRTANILKHLFPVPKSDSKRIITFANESDYISFRCVTFVTSFWRTPGFRV
jgi:hypothetical protein